MKAMRKKIAKANSAQPLIPIDDCKGLEYNNESVLLLALRGMTNTQIAERFGVTQQTISERLLRLGIKRSEFSVNIVQAFIKKKPDLLAFKQKQILDAMSIEKIEKAPLNVLGPAFGILYDKERIERGLPTEIHDIQQTNLTLVQINQQKADLMDKYPWLGKIEADGAPKNGSEDAQDGAGEDETG